MPNQTTQQLTPADAINLARNHFEAGELGACQYLCERILAALPSHALARHLLGLVAHRQGRIDAALEQLQASLTLAPQNPMFLSNTVEVMRSANRIPQAIETGERAIKAAPDSASAHSNLALACYDDGQLERAKALHAKALDLDPNHVASLNNLGSISRDEKELEQAVETYRKALRLQPHNLEVANNLSTVLIEMDRLEDAQIEVARILAGHPNDIEAVANQARIHLSRLDLDAAEATFRRVLALDPERDVAYLGLSQVLLEKNHPEAARAAAEEALNKAPENAGNLHQLGVCYNALSKPEKAREFYDRALRVDPAFKASLIGRAHLHMELGEMDVARASFAEVHRLDAADVSPLIGLSRIDKIRDAEDPVFKALEHQLPNAAAMSPANQIAFRFGLGDCYDALGRFDEAFEQYAQGAALKRSKIHYDAEARDRQVDAIVDCFTPEFIDSLRPFANPSAKPVFVLGMPRSGTTLTESILASHRSVFGAGELTDLQRFFGFDNGNSHQPYPLNLTGSTGEALQALAGRYVACLDGYSAEAAHVTDKMPSNFNLVGLIHALLPNAKIVHVRRNGMDTCLSCFTRLFDRSQHQSYDLVELGRYYNGYRRLMDHWEKMLPAEAFYTLDYQSLVEDPTGQSRALLEACDLPWDDACLAFHTAKRRVKTASITQVRQPVYKSSVEKWRRYEKHLKPLASVIGA
ncbi:tetratricopeptide repeat-containing sulfotransferase family protein [Roseibium sp. SCP14]|uniref:tetratricopeptide repeat-containing sulfotransferase family protein n=1 Tax=Roseibium sp. SCP14 TaxID=3141375 RepID=UPI0033397155